MQSQHNKIMHGYFNAVLRLRQELRQKIRLLLTENGHSDITMEMTQILYYIHYMAKNQQSNQQDIASRTGKSKSGVTSLIDHLVNRDLLNREMDQADRRNNIITLTPNGLSFIEDIYDKVNQAFDLKKAGVSLEDIEKMSRMMESLMES